MPNIKVQRHYRPDAYLFIAHTLLLVFSFILWKLYPYIPNKRDMSGLFFMIISVVGGFIGIIIIAVCLPRLDRTIRHLMLSKFVLSIIYWLSSTVIFVLFGITKFFNNSPLVLFVFVFLFLSTLYFSIIHVADMRKKDWLILGGILGSLVLLFFLPKL
jgi:uncharacterized membrane protein